MTEEYSNQDVLRLLRLLGERLESYFDGDETALETLGESIEQRGFSSDEIQAAILILQSLGAGGPATPRSAGIGTPGKHAQRILSDEERDSLSPEAWGYLLDLKRRGSLAPEEFERVLDILGGCGVRPVGVELAREVAARVALKFDDPGSLGETLHGDLDLSH